MDCLSRQTVLANPDHRDVKTPIITRLGFWIPAIYAGMTSIRTFVYNNETLAWEQAAHFYREGAKRLRWFRNTVA